MPRDALLSDLETGLGKEPSEARAYYCARCGEFMTRPAWSLAMNGTVDHVFFNPAGMVFRVACFTDAPGAVAVGSASPEFTWFRGYDWRIALCRGCSAHMGWMYEGSGAPAVFFGLIKPMLVER